LWRQATRTVPTVFIAIADPVGGGFADSDYCSVRKFQSTTGGNCAQTATKRERNEVPHFQHFVSNVEIGNTC
jgi:hypothetical protein